MVSDSRIYWPGIRITHVFPTCDLDEWGHVVTYLKLPSYSRNKWEDTVLSLASVADCAKTPDGKNDCVFCSQPLPMFLFRSQLDEIESDRIVEKTNWPFIHLRNKEPTKTIAFFCLRSWAHLAAVSWRRKFLVSKELYDASITWDKHGKTTVGSEVICRKNCCYTLFQPFDCYKTH